jgi:hypothetical protein
MVTIILSIALLLAVIGLCVEIGIASWIIRKTRWCRHERLAAERKADRADDRRRDMAKRVESLDDYASGISWLLNFLYNRYNKFADLETEVQEGLDGVTVDTSIGEADDRYKDSKKALKLIRVTVKASERMENLVDSIAAQLSQIREDLQDEGNGEKKPESGDLGKSPEGRTEESPDPEAPETESFPEDEVPGF